jgi:hypothetical protein
LILKPTRSFGSFATSSVFPSITSDLICKLAGWRNEARGGRAKKSFVVDSGECDDASPQLKSGVRPERKVLVNLRYLGDALDHWKGSLLERLRVDGAITNLAVDPMLTDRPDWLEADFTSFAGLLHVAPYQLVSHTCDLAKSRTPYFQELSHRGDLFIDPDTGMATGHVSEPAKYLYPAELTVMLVPFQVSD